MMTTLRDNLDHDVHACVLCSRGSRGRRGFTLLELLAVVIILAMVAGAVGVNAGSMSASAELRAIASQWQELDARARLHARSDGPVHMVTDIDGHAIYLTRIATNEPLARIELSSGLIAQIRINSDAPADVIAFGRTGRSDDYTATVERNGERMTWYVSGLTGWIHQQETSP